MSTHPFRHPDLNALYDLWLSQGGAQARPSAADLPAAALRPWLDNLVVIDVGPGGALRYSYYGAKLQSAFGIDMVGRSIDQLPDAQRQILQAEYDRVRSESKPAARRYTAAFDDGQQTWERLILPFFDGEGAVEKIIVCAYRVD